MREYETLQPNKRSFTLAFIDETTYYRLDFDRWPELTAPQQRRELRKSGLRVAGIVATSALSAVLWGNTGTPIATTEVDQTAVSFAQSHYQGLNLLEKYQETYVAGPVFYYGPERKGASMLGGWVAKQIQGNRDYRFGDECLVNTPYDTQTGGASWHADGKELTISPANSGGTPLKFEESSNGLLRPTPGTAATLAQKKCNETMSVWYMDKNFNQTVISFSFVGAVR